MKCQKEDIPAIVRLGLVAALIVVAVGVVVGLIHFSNTIDTVLLWAAPAAIVTTFVVWAKLGIAEAEAIARAAPDTRISEARAIERAVEHVRGIGWLDSEPQSVSAERREWYAEHGICNTIWAVTSDRCGKSQEVWLWAFFFGRESGLTTYTLIETYTSEASVMERGEAMENAVSYIRRFEEYGRIYDDRVYALMEYPWNIHWGSRGWRVYLNVGTSEPVIRVDMDAYTGRVVTALITERPLGVANDNDAEVP